MRAQPLLYIMKWACQNNVDGILVGTRTLAQIDRNDNGFTRYEKDFNLVKIKHALF